ncbi:hypothetical protein [Methylocystis bryophila]|uniref:Uncharacterized protein n=1 Tax=Methylocystis bryophila TaxID=655015 RepID=A0A1W6MSZ4_9HYPH|nr:hypothetical protein [Methylocystis bryophila]ARN80687.1 hypothetical protein B1812_05920 [Methylocystis bryophila]
MLGSSLDTPNGPDEQDEASIDPRWLGIGLNACERALNEFAYLTVGHPLWPALRRLGIRDDRASGRFLDALQIADVNPSGPGRFDFAAETGLKRSTFAAVVFPVFDDQGETIDVAAWDLDSGALALWRGAACMLGEENICAPRIEHDGLTVHPDALAWLRAGRTGVIILDPARARWRLAEERLVVDDLAFGRRLRDALRLPPPQVFVMANDARRAA